MKRRIRLTEEDLHRIVKESVNRVLSEVWDIDDEGIIDFDEFGRAKNRSYLDKHKVRRDCPSDVRASLATTPYKDPKAETNYKYRLEGPTNWEFQDDTGKWLRPSDWFVRGSDGWNDKEFLDFDRNTNKSSTSKSQKAADKRWEKAADSRPLHRKGSLNREL